MKRNIAVPTMKCHGFILRPFRKSDATSLQKAVNDPRVARDVTNIPYPYTMEHALAWVAQMEAFVTPCSRRVDFVIDIDGMVAGSVSFINLDPTQPHKAQISYWLASAYRRVGIMTQAVKALVTFGFEQMELVRIFGYVYAGNKASQGVLEKVGFIFEGVHQKEWYKVIDGEAHFFDASYYSIIRDDV